MILLLIAQLTAADQAELRVPARQLSYEICAITNAYVSADSSVSLDDLADAALGSCILEHGNLVNDLTASLKNDPVKVNAAMETIQRELRLNVKSFLLKNRKPARVKN